MTSIAVLPTAPIEIISEGGQRIAQRGAFAVDPNSLGLAPASNVSPSTVFLDWSAAGQIAAVGAEDVQYPGFGFELKVGADLLVGSPLPSASIRFLKVRWSPNGQQVAFQAETPGARGDGGGRIGDTPSDGLWVWTLVPGQESQSTHHALMNRYAYHYGAEEALMVNDFAWSPDGTRLLVELARDGDRAGQVAVIHPGWNAGDRPTTRPYEYGSWPLRDSSRMLVSGRGPEGVPVLAWVNADLSAEETLLDARTMAQPLWMQNAVHVGGSQFAFVGAPYSPGDPQFGRQSGDFGFYFYTVGSQPRLVARFGGGPVIDAQWNVAHTAVLVKLADGRVVVASIYGTQIDYSARVGGGYVGWRE